MFIRYFQKGFNFSQDGPGNRLVYHLQGCNLRCPWCSNPEGMDFARPAREETPEAVAKAVLSGRPMFFDGGGLTLTGGECTAQLEAVKTLLSLVRAEGVNTCIETNATSPAFAEILPLLDQLICDFKHSDPEAHRKWTGLDNTLIKQNIASAVATGMPVAVRIPLIHGVNDSDEALSGFLAFFAPLAAHKNVTLEILRYHEYGKDKWKKLGREYTMRDAFVTPERAAEFEKAIQSVGIQVIRT